MRKMGEYLGLVEQADYDDYDDEPSIVLPATREVETRPARTAAAPTRFRDGHVGNGQGWSDGASLTCVPTARRYGPTPWMAPGAYSWCASR